MILSLLSRNDETSETGLASADFYTALGWLAREGKLNVVVETRCGKECEYYTLNA